MKLLTLKVTHNYNRGAQQIAALDGRLSAALVEGTSRATTVLRNAVVRSVIERTTMGPVIAEAITQSSMSGRTGRVNFKPPPPGGWRIVPRDKKALAFHWPKRGPGPGFDGRWLFKSVQHPGSRPYVLIGRAALSSEALINKQWADAVGEVL